MSMYLRDGSAQTIVRAVALRQKLPITFCISPSLYILTPSQVPALTSGGVATGVLISSMCCWLVALTSKQHASLSQGRICSDSYACCHTEVDVADQTFTSPSHRNTDTGPTSLNADPITPVAWQGSHWSANFQVTGMTRPRKNLCASGIRTRDLPLFRRTP